LYTVSLFVPGIMIAADPQQGGILQMLPLLVGVGFLIFMMFGPQRSRQKKWQEALSNLKNGDRVTTSGGIRGQIISIKDDVIQLRVAPDNIKLEFTKTAILSVDVDDEKEKEKK
jgi:preprotein translocase subunit YajC